MRCGKCQSTMHPRCDLDVLQFFPKQFTVRGSQCFKEWSPWCWMIWSCSRPACLPLLFICLPRWVLVVGLFICLPLLFNCLPVFFICLPGWVPEVSSRLVFHFLAFVSHFFPQLFTVIGVLNSFLRCVRPLCHRWCPPISTGHVAFLVSALFRWPCSISIHVSPRSVTLVVSALFCRSCSISIHLSPRSVTAGVRPFSVAMRHLYSFVSQVCHWWCPPFSVTHVAFLLGRPSVAGPVFARVFGPKLVSRKITFSIP